MFIETPKTTVYKSDKETFEFLNELANFEHLMPDNIDKFEVLNENRFLFALKGMPEIVLEKKEDILVIPEALLQFDKSTNKPYVELAVGAEVDQQSKRKNIETGISDGVIVEILSCFT